MSIISLLACVLSALPALPDSQDTAVASGVFILGDPTFAGTGCHSRDVMVYLSSANGGEDLLHVGFAQSFRAQSGSTKALRKRVTCNGVIPITPKRVRNLFSLHSMGYCPDRLVVSICGIIQGYTIGITEKRVAGFVSVPHNDVGSYAQVTSNAFFAGDQGTKTQKKFDSAGIGPFDLEVGTDGVTTWSKCGTASSLRINTALVTNGPDTTIAFESLEQHGLLYSVSFKICVSSDSK